MVQAGLIINIGSIAGEMGMGPQSVYAATKWGLRGWSLSCYEVCLPSLLWRATRHAIAGAVLQQCCTDLVYAALYTHPHWLKQTLMFAKQQR